MSLYRIWIMRTPQKSNIDTKNCHCLKGVTFSIPLFWVSMLVFRGVVLKSWSTLPTLRIFPLPNQLGGSAQLNEGTSLVFSLCHGKVFLREVSTQKKNNAIHHPSVFTRKYRYNHILLQYIHKYQHLPKWVQFESFLKQPNAVSLQRSLRQWFPTSRCWSIKINVAK